MGSAVERTDKHVREYLIYRGFTGTLKQLDSDIKADKEKGFRVDKIIDQLQQLVQSFDLFGLKEYWFHLDRRLFCRLEDVYRSTVNKLRTSIYRYYIINTIQKGNLEKTQEFFQKQALELQGQAEWRDWFILPFIPAPEQNPAFSPYFSRQWADTFLVSLHNFLSVLFQCMPQPVLLSFDAEVQKMTSLTEENEQLRQKLFALHTESRDQKEGDEMVQHKLPLYVQNMDRLGDTELDLVSSQRAISATVIPSRNFFSTFLPQGKRTPVKAPPITVGSSPSQAAVGRKESSVNQMAKPKEASQSKEVKAASNQSSSGESASSQSQQTANQTINQHSRHKRIQEHEKERKELFSRPSSQTPESKGEDVDLTPAMNISGEPPESSSREEGGLPVEQPFIKLSQEEYGEHHSSIMHCRVDSSGRRVASLDVDGVIKVWSFNPIMQTKATIMSKSPLLSLEWATKPDRLLLLGSGVGTVRLYDTDAKKNLYEMNIDETHPRILSLACSPSGSSFVCSAAALSWSGGDASVPRLPIPVSGQLLLWDTKTVKQQLQFSLEPEPVAINCTAFNHNGNLLVTGAADGVIRLFDMQRYESAMSWRAHDGEVYSVEFSYDENTVFSVGEDGKFIQWNIHRCGVKQSEQVLPQDATGPFVLSGYSGYKQVQVPRGRLFAFDSEGQHVLTCSSGGGLIYRLTNDEPALERVLSLGGHKAPVVTVDWCSAVDCGTCLTASMDGKIKLSTLLAQKS
ncbi:WD repeat-containing protein 91 [Girardinichthys multiradiatus]|uniref:WD repeat-containing protein 91 n=1 Tax=Girardinichthys multiradiatus TaxID=208333 RepID=UPI001FADD7CE|nr:WD repeat-containing protein 91 [Girardinichthys multiradiatus]XP_047229148.1 WD repeat-containing protein 91 [Girardinichthys multiradiatus]XP_047229149.1 WD repeat-containing protein 91 [Girardinichthys multiradiatus]XP_047229150.1 WD repeat-containing protein 91 [Girardinichthys multiradiatus]